MARKDIYRFEELTWPEINDAVTEGRIPVLGVGCIEEHGPHLPLSTDWLRVQRVVEEAARRSNELLLAMPSLPYGYITHAMDFLGCITIEPQHLFDFCLDIVKSLAYHGFKRIIILNGHGSGLYWS